VGSSHTGPAFPNEIVDNGDLGDLDGQIREVVADGYSIYHVLANLIDGSGYLGRLYLVLMVDRTMLRMNRYLRSQS
jgi:hypothetical protein